MQTYEDAAQQFAALEPLDEKNLDQRSISFSFSLQIISREGLSVRGDAHMQRTRAGIPLRASRPANTDDLYDDQLPQAMPRSAIRWRPTHQAPAGHDVTAPTTTAPEPTATQTTDQLAPKATHRLSRMWLFALPALVVILFMTALPGLQRQWHTGDHNTQTWEINGDSFTTWVDKGQVNILVEPHGDAAHAQLVPSKVLGSHVDGVTVELMGQGNGVFVFINNTQVGQLVPNGQGGYKWM